MSVNDFTFGVTNPTIDELIQKQYPGIVLNGTELLGMFADVREINGALWMVVNAAFNQSTVGYTQQNTAKYSYALVVGLGGTAYTAYQAAPGAANPIVWTATSTTPQGFSVMSYGAKGDGVTDDTVAIQTAMNAAAVANAPVFFPVPSVSYLTTATLNGTYNMQLSGLGSASVIKSTTADPIVSVVFTSSSATAAGPAITNLRFITGATNAATVINQTAPNRAQPARIKGCFFDSSANTNAVAKSIVTLSNLWASSITDCYFDNAASGSATNFNTTAVAVQTCISTTISNCAFYGYGYAIVSQKFGTGPLNESTLITNNYSWQCNTSVYLKQSFSDAITGNTFDNSLNSCIVISKNPAGGDNVSVVQVTGNALYCYAALNAGIAALLMEYVSSVVVNGNTITQQNSGNYGLQNGTNSSYGPLSGNNVVTGNVFVGFNKFISAILLGPGIGQGNVVANNLINTSQGCTANPIAYDSGSISAQFGLAPSLTLKNNIGNTNTNGPNLNPVGSLTPPAVPASAAWQFNPFPFTVTVYVKGGTVSAIDLAGPSGTLNTAGTAVITGTALATGAVAAFPLEPGMAIRLTYTVAPTWTWVGA